MTPAATPRAARPVLFAITDRGVASASRTVERLARLARGGRPGTIAVQLRDRELSVRERLAFGGELSAAVRGAGQFFQVNDRIDLALLLEADGVHLGEDSVDTPAARSLLGKSAFVSRACHDPALAGSVDADAVLLSPVLAARKGRPPLGSEALARARRGMRPETLLVALGGIEAQTAQACLEAGANGVAAIGAILDDDQGERLIETLGIAR